MDEMFSGDINLKKLDLEKFDRRYLISWNDIWKNITNLTVKIDTSLNEKILDNIPPGIIIIDEN